MYISSFQITKQKKSSHQSYKDISDLRWRCTFLSCDSLISYKWETVEVMLHTQLPSIGIWNIFFLSMSNQDYCTTNISRVPTIRENRGKSERILFFSGKSGNLTCFFLDLGKIRELLLIPCEWSGKVREFCSETASFGYKQLCGSRDTIIPGIAYLDWVAILPVWKLTWSIYSALQEWL